MGQELRQVPSTIGEIYVVHGFSVPGLAVQAGVSVETIENLLLNLPVPKERAYQCGIDEKVRRTI